VHTHRYQHSGRLPPQPAAQAERAREARMARRPFRKDRQVERTGLGFLAEETVAIAGDQRRGEIRGKAPRIG